MSDVVIPGIGVLEPVPVWDREDLVAEPVKEALRWLDKEHPELHEQILVCEISEEFADTEAMTAKYGMDLDLSVNCIVVTGKRQGEERTAACAVRATTQLDVNHVVKRMLDVRKASFMSQKEAVARTGMEYGGITMMGIPEEWRLLVDSQAADGWACIGSGLRRSKLFVTGNVLAALPGVGIIEGLATSVE